MQKIKVLVVSLWMIQCVPGIVRNSQRHFYSLLVVMLMKTKVTWRSWISTTMLQRWLGAEMLRWERKRHSMGNMTNMDNIKQWLILISGQIVQGWFFPFNLRITFGFWVECPGSIPKSIGTKEPEQKLNLNLKIVQYYDIIPQAFNSFSILSL